MGFSKVPLYSFQMSVYIKFCVFTLTTATVSHLTQGTVVGSANRVVSLLTDHMSDPLSDLIIGKMSSVVTRVNTGRGDKQKRISD